MCEGGWQITIVSLCELFDSSTCALWFAYRGLLIERGWTTSEFEAPKMQKFIIGAKSKRRSLKNYVRKKMMRNANLFRWNA